MKMNLGFLFVSAVLLSCGTATVDNKPTPAAIPLVGTWKLLTGTLIEKGDTTVTDYTKNVPFIKIINDTHFAFMQHDLTKGKDTARAVFSSGAGTYTLNDSTYTEHLEYCSAREWENNDFKFTIVIKGDTLTQTGIEIVESAGVNRLNIERYVRLKK